MNEQEVSGMMAALEGQRNSALNQVAQMNGLIAVKDARIKELEAQIEKTTADNPPPE